MKRLKKPRYIIDVLCMDGGTDEPQTLRLHFANSPRRKARSEAKELALKLAVPCRLLCFDEPSVHAPIKPGTWHHFDCLNGRWRKSAANQRRAA